MKYRLYLASLFLLGISFSALAGGCGGIAGTYIGNFDGFGLPNSNYTIAIYSGGGGALINESSVGKNVLWHDFNATKGAFGQFTLSWKVNQNSQGNSNTYSVAIIGQAAFVPTDGSPLLPTTQSERVILKSNNVVVNTDCSISGTFTGQSFPADNLALDNPYPSIIDGSTTFTLPLDHVERIN